MKVTIGSNVLFGPSVQIYTAMHPMNWKERAIEACAGLLDKDNPEDCIRRETEEETGYKVSDVRKVFEAYMSPGSVTEILYFFVAEYSKQMKVNDGGGIEHEQEDIEVVEITLDKAMQMIGSGEIKDGKTIMLLRYAKLKNLV